MWYSKLQPGHIHACVSKIYNNDTGTLISICSCIEYQRLNEYVAKIAAFLHDVAISDTQGCYCFASSYLGFDFDFCH